MENGIVEHEYLSYYAEYCKKNKIVEIVPGGFSFPDGTVIRQDVLFHALTNSQHDYFGDAEEQYVLPVMPLV
jgi:hypothetical protein